MKTIVLLALILASIHLGGARAEQAAIASEAQASEAGKTCRQMPDFSTLVRRQGPVVVQVRVFRERPDEPAEAPGAPKRQPLLPQRESGTGSGFVVAPNGIVLTNRHVVDGAEKITLRFADRHELPARVLGVDPLTDVAVLKVEAQNLPTATLGDSSKLEVGQWVLAIGAPLGLERTATQGIISALGRALPNDSYVPFIQTDVPINPGNSGGPLFDLDGRVVGINAQIVSSSGGYMGLSFAIPINTAVAVARQILEKGHATHGWIGVSAQDLTLELAQAYGLDTPRGALITQLRPAGPAEQAGLRPGDIILALDEMPVTESGDLPPIIGASQPGSEHLLTVLRDGKLGRLKVKVGELGQGKATRSAAALIPIDWLGLRVSDLDAATQQVMGLAGGVLVEDAMPGPATEAGIQVGDILLKLGRHPLESASQLRDLATGLARERPIPVLVRRQENTTFVTIALPKAE